MKNFLVTFFVVMSGFSAFAEETEEPLADGVYQEPMENQYMATICVVGGQTYVFKVRMGIPRSATATKTTVNGTEYIHVMFSRAGGKRYSIYFPTAGSGMFGDLFPRARVRGSTNDLVFRTRGP